MSFNEGRNIYLHEILVDYLKNTEEYSDENIQKKLVQLYKLKKRENIKPSVLSRDERIELSKLKTFFSKNLEITFSDSRLIYPRFKEAYSKAKSAIINLRSAYDNVITEYYKLLNNGYYEYKDPKYLAYLNYIKKKIIIAKANIGMFDYSEIKDYNLKKESEPTLHIDDESAVPLIQETATSSKFDIASLQNTNDKKTSIGTQVNASNTGNTAGPVSTKGGPESTKGGPESTKGGPESTKGGPESTKSVPVSTEGGPVSKEGGPEEKKEEIKPEAKPLYTIGNENEEKLKYMLMITPPPLFGGEIINNKYEGGDSREYLNQINPEKNDKDIFKMPTTLQEKYIIEGKYIDKILNDFDDIDQFTKNIKEIKTYISDELYTFIYGSDNSNNKEGDNQTISENSDINGGDNSIVAKIAKINSKIKIVFDKNSSGSSGDTLESIASEISEIKNELLKYENSKQIENLLGKKSDFINNEKKYLDFLQKKLPEIYNKDNDIYIKNFAEIKAIVNGTNLNYDNRGNNKLTILINDFHKYSIDIYNILKDSLKQYKNRLIELDNIVKSKITTNEKIDIEKAKSDAYIDTKVHRGLIAAERSRDIEQRVKTAIQKTQYMGQGGDNNAAQLHYKYKILFKNLEINTINLKLIFKDIQKQIKSKYDDPFKKVSLNNRSDGEDHVQGTSIFDKIWKNYINDIKDDRKLIENTEDKLYEAIKINDLDPIVVLELTFNDKLLFIVISYFIRQLSLNIVEYFIDNSTIKDIITALIFYVICYTIIIIILTVFINLDNYKLRIIFNYFNLHVNKFNIIMHVFIISVFTFLIYTLIVNINFPIQNINQKYISESDKLKLMYRLDILTIIIYIFTSLFIILM